MRWLYAAFWGPMFFVAACSPNGTQGTFSEEGGGGEGTSTSGAGGSGGMSSSSTGENITVGVGGSGSGSGTGGGGNGQVAEVYGHGPNTLYRLDPLTKDVKVIGPFKGCSYVIDIAIDKDSNLFGTTSSNLYKIDKNTAECTPISSGSYPNSLSFVPAGTVDPTSEALVGYNGAQYVQIDTTTGVVKNIGMIGGNYYSSGDIVSVIGGKTYLTVTGNGCSDCIIEVNPATGALVKNYGPVGYGAVYGLAFWAGTAYGFTDSGQIFEVQFSADAVVTKPISIPGNPASLQFWGAGSTTSAPPDPIPE